MADIGEITPKKLEGLIFKKELDIDRQKLQIKEMKARRIDIDEDILRVENNILIAEQTIQRLQTELQDLLQAKDKMKRGAN